MDHFAGLDVSVKETSVCIVDDTGKIVREVKVASEPEALLAVLKNPAYHFKRIGLEAGPLSQWLFSALAEAELPVVCVETRHMQAVLKAQINKTDRNDANRRGEPFAQTSDGFFERSHGQTERVGNPRRQNQCVATECYALLGIRPLVPSRTFRQCRQFCETAFEVADRFKIGKACCGVLAGFQPFISQSSDPARC
jgi:hypothetical protein